VADEAVSNKKRKKHFSNQYSDHNPSEMTPRDPASPRLSSLFVAGSHLLVLVDKGSSFSIEELED
jgi:hypothetical protein